MQKARGLGDIVPLDLLVLAMAHARLGNQGAAGEFCGEARAWMRANRGLDPDLTRFAREMDELIGGG